MTAQPLAVMAGRTMLLTHSHSIGNAPLCLEPRHSQVNVLE